MTADVMRISVGDLRLLVPDFRRAPKAANKSPKTVGICADAAWRMIDFFLANGMPTEEAKMTREHRSRFPSSAITTWPNCSPPATAGTSTIDETRP